MKENHFRELVDWCRNIEKCDEPQRTELPSGGEIIEISGVRVEGWNRSTVKVLFLVPASYPAGQPDCFWVEPGEFRLKGGGTPQSSSDGSQIPGDVNTARSTTWFSWHIQTWNPSRDTLLTYFRVILKRLKPAR